MRLTNKILALTAIVTIAGCGGGGGSSSSGGGSGSSAYAGTYAGTITATALGKTESTALTLQVSSNGTVTGLLPDLSSVNAQCSNVPTAILQGSTLSYSGTMTCSAPQIGSCNISFTSSGNISGNTFSGTYQSTWQCSVVGSFSANETFSATKSS